MSFLGIQIGLLQIALQNADPFVSHQLYQGENIRAISEQGKCEGFLEIMFILAPYQLVTGSRLALLASYLLQPAATPVTRYGKMDVVDILSPTGGDRMERQHHLWGGGHYGQPKELSYTEKARGSSPFAPTQMPPPARPAQPRRCPIMQFHPVCHHRKAGEPPQPGQLP